MSLNPSVMIMMAIPNRMTPTITVRTSRSVGYAFSAFGFGASPGGLRRMRETRGCSLPSRATVGLFRFLGGDQRQQGTQCARLGHLTAKRGFLGRRRGACRKGQCQQQRHSVSPPFDLGAA